MILCQRKLIIFRDGMALKFPTLVLMTIVIELKNSLLILKINSLDIVGIIGKVRSYYTLAGIKNVQQNVRVCL